MPCAPLSGVGNSSRRPTHVPSSKIRLRRSDPPLTVREAPREPTRSTNTLAQPEARSGYRTRLRQGDTPSVTEQGPRRETSLGRVRGLAAPGVNLLSNMDLEHYKQLTVRPLRKRAQCPTAAQLSEQLGTDQFFQA
jgi:hypothetical protein